MRNYIDEEVAKERIERKVESIPIGGHRRICNRTVHRRSAYMFEMKIVGERSRTALVAEDVVQELTGNGW